ncbi:MAG TPA: MerR family transcriptional regulator [Actinomycetota bacterium]|nr:MerR family transcriptional regulator [Actinomycetota bacterium]
MDAKPMTIGEIAKRTGLPVKTVRFYSDEGLLPPAQRTQAGYRLYSDSDLVRLDLIRTLREAGLDLAAIRAVLSRELSLAQALELRLRAIEAHVTSLGRVAAAIRAALKTGPDEADLRRLQAVTRLSNEERKAVIEGFYQQVSEGIPIDEQWTQDMIEASTPQLPDDPTPQQLDAWVEMSGILSDPQFLQGMRESASRTWSADFDLEAAKTSSEDAVLAAREAMDRGEDPRSDSAGAIVREFVETQAAANGQQPDDAFVASFVGHLRDQDPRAMRYWELVAVMNGAPEITSRVDEWRWLTAAVVHHLSR